MTEEARAPDRFEEIIDKMPEYLLELEKCKVITKDNSGKFSPSLPTDKGIYVFYEGEMPMYVGRSDRLRNRLHEHGRPSSDSNSASFAFNIAKREQLLEDLKEIERSGTQDIPESIRERYESRSKLEGDPEFTSRFNKSKRRVRNMSIRVVEVQDAIEQAILDRQV